MKKRTKKKQLCPPEKKRRYDIYRFSPRELFLYSIAAVGITLVVNYLFYRSWYGCLLAVLMIPMILYLVKRDKIRKRKETLHYHFKDALSSILTALRAGYSLENAVKEAYRDVGMTYGEQDCITEELRQMCHQMKLQIPIEALFEDLGSRSGINDIETFAGVLQIAKRTGGSMDQILQETWRTLSEKIETRQEIDAAIAAKRYEQMIMSIMPAAIIVYMQLSFPDMLNSMYHNPMGILIMTVCLAVYGGAWLLGRKIVEIEV
ncbi:MAG: type II secretion system F family protein [Lachnospiraceae bacterium]|nr:type II secretion system F family protein [Lachnospiraceae bacterium]